MFTRINEKQPNVLNIGYIPHLENPCVAVGIMTVSVSVDDFFVDIYFHSNESVKRYFEGVYTDVEHMQIS